MAIKTNLFLFYKLIYFWFVFLPSGAYFELCIALLVIARMNNWLNIKYHFDEQNSEHLKKIAFIASERKCWGSFNPVSTCEFYTAVLGERGATPWKMY